MPVGAAMRVHGDESLAENIGSSMVPSIQGRERRQHVLYLIFTVGKSNLEEDLKHHGKTQAVKGTNLL